MLHKSGKSHLATVVGEEGEIECGADEEGDNHLPQHSKVLAGVGFYLIKIVASSVQIRMRLPAIWGIHGGDEQDRRRRRRPDFFRFLFFFSRLMGLDDAGLGAGDRVGNVWAPS